ncbi:uncharacterized protein V6R79_020961 [Siganus canaliculatus]
MDPSNQLHLGCQLSNPRNNSANNPRKRKWVHEDPEEPSKKRRKTLSLSQGPSQTVEDTKTVKKGLKGKREDIVFDIYKQEKKIGQGAFGCVFAGYRKSDHLPVALKWTHIQNVTFTAVSEHGKETLVPQEVALLLALKDVPAVVTLLDWYQLDLKVVLVLERPEKCLNLSEYITSSGGLKEHSVKNIIQQIVDAFAEIHLRGVFHSDIKLENILIDHSPNVTRFRVIDFGCGSFLTPGDNKEPVTVAQIGEVLSKLLKASLDNGWEITKDCRDFLAACLWKKAKTRPSLHELKSHPWLNTLNPTN